MSSRKIVVALSLGSFLAVAAGVIVASEVRAGEVHQIPIAGAVDAATLERAAAFEGEYTFAGGQKQRDGVAEAIETSVEAVSPLVRNMGRKRLRETNPVPKLLKITVDGDQVGIFLDGDGHDVSLSAKPLATKSRQGDKIEVSHRVRGASLVQFIDGVGGDRSNQLQLSEDGQRVTMKVKITSGHLPVPVEYRLTFKRK